MTSHQLAKLLLSKPDVDVELVIAADKAEVCSQGQVLTVKHFKQDKDGPAFVVIEALVDDLNPLVVK